MNGPALVPIPKGAVIGAQAVPIPRRAVPIPKGATIDAVPIPAPRVGAIEDGYQFRGGDPANPANWLAVPKPGSIQDGYRFKGGNPAIPADWEAAAIPFNSGAPIELHNVPQAHATLGPARPYSPGLGGVQERLQDALSITPGSPALKQAMAGPVFGPLEAARGVGDVASGVRHLNPTRAVTGFNEIVGGLGRAAAPFAAVAVPESIPLMIGMSGAGTLGTRGLHALGLNEPYAEAVTNAALLGAGLFGRVFPGEAEAPASNWGRAWGEKRLLRALRPPANAEGAELRGVVHEALPELEAVARTRPLRGVKELHTRAVAEAIGQRARDIEQNEHAPIIARLANEPVEMAPVGQAAVNRISPAEYRENPAATEAALRFAQRAAEPTNLREADAFRRILRRELSNKFGRLQGPEIEARKGAVSELVNQIEQTAARHGEPSLRAINQRYGRLGRIARRLEARAPVAELEPGRGERLGRDAHVFVGSAAMGHPYVGLFARPLEFVRQLVRPNSTNELVRAAMRNLGPARRSAFDVLRSRLNAPTPAEAFGGEPAPPAGLPRGQYNAPQGAPPAGPKQLPGLPFERVASGPLQTAYRPPRPVRGLLLPKNPPGNVALPSGVVTESPLDLMQFAVPRPGGRVLSPDEARRTLAGHALPIEGGLAPATEPEAWLRHLVAQELSRAHAAGKSEPESEPLPVAPPRRTRKPRP